jgi:hypothetical protein
MESAFKAPWERFNHQTLHLVAGLEQHLHGMATSEYSTPGRNPDWRKCIHTRSCWISRRLSLPGALSTPQQDDQMEISLIFTSSSGITLSFAEEMFEALGRTAIQFSTNPNDPL